LKAKLANNMKQAKNIQKRQRESNSKTDKLELLQKAKEKRGKITPKTSQNLSNNQMNYQALYRKMKKERDFLIKKQQEAKPSIPIKESKEYLLLQDELIKVKQKLYETRKERDKKEEENQKLLKDFAHLESKLTQTSRNKDMLQIEKDKLGEDFLKIKTRIDNIRKKNEHIQHKNEKLQETINEKEEQIQTYQTYLKENSGHIKELRKYMRPFLIMRPDIVISHLMESMHKQNVVQFRGIPSLFRQYENILASHHMRKYLSRSTNTYLSRGTNSKLPIEEVVLFGHLEKEETEHAYRPWRFICANGERYEVIQYRNLPIEKGDPVSAVVDTKRKKAIVTWIYESESEMNKDIQSYEKLQKKKKGNHEDDILYTQIEPISVLLVTAKNGVKFRDRLEKHGVRAKVMDAYEQNISHIKKIASSFDYVFLFKDAIPHSALTIIEEKREDGLGKYQLFPVTNESSVVARARYLSIHYHQEGRQREKESTLM